MQHPVFGRSLLMLTTLSVAPSSAWPEDSLSGPEPAQMITSAVIVEDGDRESPQHRKAVERALERLMSLRRWSDPDPLG